MNTITERSEKVAPFYVPKPSPMDVAAQKLAAFKMVEDSLGLSDDFDGQADRLLGQIKNQDATARNYRTQAAEAEENLNAVELDIAGLVAAEPDPMKPSQKLFSNADARTAETSRRKANSTDYQKEKTLLSRARNNMDTADMELRDLERRLNALHGTAKRANARLNAFAACG